MTISHVEPTVWHEVYSFIFGGGPFDKIQYDRHRGRQHWALLLKFITMAYVNHKIFIAIAMAILNTSRMV